MNFGDIEVMTEGEEYVFTNSQSLMKRTFTVKYKGEEKNVTQIQILDWPDHNVPNSETGFKSLDYIINTISEFKSCITSSPVLIHCGAGTGRTGTLIAIYNIIRSFTILKYVNLSENLKLKPFLSVFNVVRKLREKRYGMVSDLSQYTFIYEFVFKWLSRNFDFQNDADNLM
jgi:protein tyrosine phosphatase